MYVNHNEQASDAFDQLVQSQTSKNESEKQVKKDSYIRNITDNFKKMFVSKTKTVSHDVGEDA